MAMTQDYVHRDVRVGPYKTHYIECGDGQPVVMIHGGGPGASGEFGWRNNVPAIGERGRAIAVDLISYGLTDKPAADYTYQFIAEHLAQFIDKLCLDEIYMTGNSMGAYMAARYALDHPGRVKKLLLVGSGTIGMGMGLDMGMTPGLQKLVNYDGTIESLRGVMEGLMYQPDNITQEQLQRRFEQATLPGVTEAQKSFITHFRETLKTDAQAAQWFSIRNRLPELDIPIHFVWGRHDVFATPDLAEGIESMLPNATFEWFEESGHVVQNDESERYNQVALKFFFDR